MNGKTTIVIAVVAVVIIAGAGVGVFLLNNKSENIKIESSLPVYGNANGDYKIDSKDVELIQSIIDGKESYEDHPLADAWKDDVIDQKDIDHVNGIINKTADKVWYINKKGEEQTVRDAKWPITKCIATATSNIAMYFKMLGLEDRLAAVSYGSSSRPDATLFPTIAAMPSIGTGTNITYSNAAPYLKGGVTAVVTSTNSSYLSTSENDYWSHSISVLRIDATGTDMKDFVGAVLMMGFMFDSDKNVEKICSFSEDIMRDINDRLSKIPDDQRKVAMAQSSANKVTSKTSDYTQVLIAAGAKFPNDDRANSGGDLPDGATWVYDIDIDYFIALRVSTGIGGSWFGGTVNQSIADDVLHCFYKTDAYKKGNTFIICGELATPLRIAYAAECMYPDQFEEGFADRYNQEFCDTVFGPGSYDISSLTFIYRNTVPPAS